MKKFVFNKRKQQTVNTFPNETDNNTALGYTKGTMGIIGQQSHINIENSDIDGNTKILSLKNNEISLDKNTTFYNELSTSILSDQNSMIACNMQINSNVSARQAYINKSLYNFPSPFFSTENTKMDENTTLLPQLPAIYKPVVNDGVNTFFGSFKDGKLLNNIYLSSSNGRITYYSDSKSNITKYQTDIDLDNFLSNLPVDFNGYTIQVTITNVSTEVNTHIQNIIGGNLILNIQNSPYLNITCTNCKNITILGISSECTNNSLGYTVFKNCKNIIIKNINFNQINPARLKLADFDFEKQSDNLGCLYFDTSIGQIFSCRFERASDNQCQMVGIIAYNSKIYIAQQSTFVNCVKNCELIGFSTVDTNETATTLAEYNNQILSGESVGISNLNGLYKHLHTTYIPVNNALPMGSILGYPRVVNGEKYVEQYNKATSYSDSMLYTNSMINDLPECFIPLDSNDSSLWRTQYEDKIAKIFENDLYKSYKNLSADMIVPFDSASAQNSYFLFGGTLIPSNANNQKYYGDIEVNRQNIPNLSKILSGDITFASNIKIAVPNGCSYTIGKVNDGIVCNKRGSTTDTISSNALSATLSFKQILSDLVGNTFAYLKDMLDNTNQAGYLSQFFKYYVYAKSYVEFALDNNTITLTFDDLIYKTPMQIAALSGFITGNNKTSLTFKESAIPVSFNTSITSFKVYYFGIPANMNCDYFIGENISNDYLQINGTEQVYDAGIYQNTDYSIKTTLRLPHTCGYYAYYIDTILCYFLSDANTDVAVTVTGEDDDNTSQGQKKYMQSIFRQVSAAYTASQKYIYLSGIVTAETSSIIGTYERLSDTSNVWRHALEYVDDTDKMPYATFTNNNTWTFYYNNATCCTFANTNKPTGTNNGYMLYSPAYGQLERLNTLLPSCVLDIELNYETVPLKYMETYDLVEKSYGFIPASAYNFDYSRKSVNSNVSGYFRILQQGKKYIHIEDYSNRILSAKVNGFENTLNELYNSLISLDTEISRPMYEYITNNKRYEIYPFNTQSVLSTTVYTLNIPLIRTNAFIATINRLTDVLTYKHSTLITDGVKNTRKDIVPSAMYGIHPILSTQYMDTIGMVYPLYTGTVSDTTFTPTTSIIAAGIPYIKDMTLSGLTPVFKYGNTSINAYPIGGVSNDTLCSSKFYLDLKEKDTTKAEICTHLYNTLPLLYNLTELTYTSNTAFTYTTYIELPKNDTVSAIYFNNVQQTIAFNNLTQLQNTVRSGGQLKIATNNGTYLFLIPANCTLQEVKYNTGVLPKVKKYYAYENSFIPTNQKMFNSFINNYNLPINYMLNKLNAIWKQVLSHCDNEASLMSYNTILQNDLFIFGMQNESPTLSTVKFDMDDIKAEPINLSQLFSLYGTVQYFQDTTINKIDKSNSWFTNNYKLNSFLS